MKKYIILAGVAILFALCIAFQSRAEPEYIQQSYVVTKGETLWGIGEQYSTGDIRGWIYEVKKLNGGRAEIYTGEVITILVNKKDPLHLNFGERRMQ